RMYLRCLASQAIRPFSALSETARARRILMSPRRVFALAIRIVRQFLRDHRTLALLFIAPLFVMTLLNLVLNNSSSGATLGIVAPESGPGAGSALIDQARGRLSGAGGITIVPVARTAVDTALRNGDADAVLIFPETLGPGTVLTLRLEGSNPGAAE